MSICRRKKIACFFCFYPNYTEEVEASAVHLSPDFPLPPSSSRRRQQGPQTEIASASFSSSISESIVHTSSPNFQRHGRRARISAMETISATESMRRSASEEEIFSSSSSASSPKSSSSSSSFCSSSSSSFCSSSSPNFLVPEQIIRLSGTLPREKVASEGRCVGAVVLCLLVVSLMAMVFCGRLCAILLTVSWICFLPRRNPTPGTEELCGAEMHSEAAVATELRRKEFYDWEWEKKRIVLEGFLERRKRV